MKTREWTVGLLSELHPQRDPTLLGLNRNAGEAIYLRILTDDLSGLRPVSTVSIFHSLCWKLTECAFCAVLSHKNGLTARAYP